MLIEIKIQIKINARLKIIHKRLFERVQHAHAAASPARRTCGRLRHQSFEFAIAYSTAAAQARAEKGRKPN